MLYSPCKHYKAYQPYTAYTACKPYQPVILKGTVQIVLFTFATDGEISIMWAFVNLTQGCVGLNESSRLIQV